jgi:hypothetical protein
VDEVSAVVHFYRRAFDLGIRFFDETLGFAELETGGSPLAIAAHSLGEMLMPNQYVRPPDGQPTGVEIAFYTRDVPASFAKAIGEAAIPISPPRRMPWGLEVAYVVLRKVRSLVSLNRRPPRPNEDHATSMIRSIRVSLQHQEVIVLSRTQFLCRVR